MAKDHGYQKMSEKVVTTPGDVALDAEMHGTNATTGEGCDDLER